MALKFNDWVALSTKEKNNIVSFLTNNCKIDLETPVRNKSTIPGNYPIEEGTTIGGYDMKFGEEYRIYVKNIFGIPPFLETELKERGTKNRIGGSDTIKAIMTYAGFKVGNN
ncbi:MAG: hypothetical protein FWF92_06465 [Oscillospiraceae bacterium]|nr:hypothetical protein [Oscillospiraceae bacterium]